MLRTRSVERQSDKNKSTVSISGDVVEVSGVSELSSEGCTPPLVAPPPVATFS